MTPAARVQSAIEILDTILSGIPSEQALTRWARANRFAGSKDRAAIRDHVFTAIRCKRSYAAMGGSETGRGLMIGALKSSPDGISLFDGSNYGPEELSEEELSATVEFDDLTEVVQSDVQDWIWEKLKADLGGDAASTVAHLRHRANVFLRVNSKKSDIDKAVTLLKADQIEARPHPLSNTALLVTNNERRIAQSTTYKDGIVELQDVASQAVCDFLELTSSGKVLDYCAGGGGKSLAMASKTNAEIHAHDVSFDRMKDLPTRAERAGVTIKTLRSNQIIDQYDLVLCDVPCSGSGSWRRSPDGKWSLTPEQLENLHNTQAEILQNASQLVAKGGEIAYATCSLFKSENDQQVEKFLKSNPDWQLIAQRQFLPNEGGDGFYVARLNRV